MLGLEVAFGYAVSGLGAVSSAVAIASSPLLKGTINKLSQFVQTQEQVLKSKLAVPKVLVDEIEFLGICNAIQHYDPNQKGNVQVGQYDLESVFKKIAPETLNNRFTLDSQNQKSYSLISFIIEQTKIYISSEKNSNVKRDHFILAMNKLIAVLNATKNLKIQLTAEDNANLKEIERLRGDQQHLTKLTNTVDFTPIDVNLLPEEIRVLNADRLDRMSKSFEGNLFDESKFPHVYKAGDFLGAGGTPLDTYVASLHPDTINNLFDGNRSLLTTFLRILNDFIDGNKQPKQDKNAFSVLSFLIQASVDKGASISDEDNRLCKSINTKLAKYKEDKPSELVLKKSQATVARATDRARQNQLDSSADQRVATSASTSSTSQATGVADGQGPLGMTVVDSMSSGGAAGPAADSNLSRSVEKAVAFLQQQAGGDAKPTPPAAATALTTTTSLTTTAPATATTTTSETVTAAAMATQQKVGRGQSRK